MKNKLMWYAYISENTKDIELRFLATSIHEADEKLKQFTNHPGFFCAYSYPDL